MAKAETTSITSRRTLLGTMAAIPAASALAAPVVATDPHREWLIIIEESWRQMDVRPGLPDAEMDRLGGKVRRHQDLIAETPANSWDGVICQIKVGHYANDGLATPEAGMQALDNAIAAIKTMAGRA